MSCKDEVLKLSGIQNNQTNYQILSEVFNLNSCNHILSLLPKIPKETEIQVGRHKDYTNQWMSNNITKYRLNLPKDHDANEYISYKLQNILKDLKLKIEYMYITFYREGNICKVHDDPVHTTGIILLSDNFEGGEFYIEPNIVDIRIGDLLLFQNKNNLHGVKKIQSGCRYALSIWLSKR